MKKEMLYEGKAKIIYATDKDDEVIVYYKDDATAFNGLKKETIANKGILNKAISTYIFDKLEQAGVKTHFIKSLDEKEQLCKKVDVIALEFICRNQVYGSMAKRLGIEQGLKLEEPLFEICYKNDDLNDPLIIDAHAYVLGLVNKDQLQVLYKTLGVINEELIKIFLELNIILIDFKVEFGFDKEGNILLCDEISPDSCRLLDKDTNEQLDKDLFRHDTGDITSTYKEILNRIEKKCKED